MDHMISGDEVQTLQFVLQPGHKMTIDTNSLCWCNSAITLQSRGLFFARLLSANISIGDALNETTTPAILSLNQIGSGKILIIKVEKPLYCFKDSFVCATEEVNISPKVLPFDLSLITIGIPQLFNKAHYCTSSTAIAGAPIGRSNGDGRIFLQSGGLILTKELKTGESLVIKFNCMVAFEETCKINVVDPFQNIVQIFGGNDTYLKVDGPGNVYFSAHNFSRKATSMQSRLGSKTFNSNMSIVGFCLVGFSFYILSVMLNMIALEIDHNHIM